MRIAALAAFTALVAATAVHAQDNSGQFDGNKVENPMASMGDTVSDGDMDKFMKARSANPTISAPPPNKFRSSAPDLTVESFKRVTRSANGDISEAPAAPGTEESIEKLKKSGEGMDRSRMQRRAPTNSDIELGENSGQAKGNRTVIGTDDRIRVDQTNQYPFSTLGYIYSEYDDNTAGSCSGTMISPTLVLTAAHCVYRTETSKWATYVVFVPGRNDRQAPLGQFEAAQWTITQGYLDQSGKEYGYDHLFHDVAVLELKEPAGKATGWLSIGYNDQLPNFHGNVIGYPGDKPDGTMWSASCPIDPNFIAPSLFEMECDTYPGSSGSSIYAFYKEQDKRVIYGVNVASTDKANYGIRITGPYFDYLKTFMDAQKKQ
ncbi:trypsin-like serine peptidase [Tepidamorphus sp. 3E244]|uniref:trypsin-like serine peptidase n=1 Tax=Tepidamorphus sp. 3E244 TaxID=3385498 RepID=UPI0038FD1838